MINSIAALDAGATRVHGDGARHRRARRQHADGPAARQPRADGLQRARSAPARRVLPTVVAEACGVPIPDNYPVVGRDAFRTATGVHAAAVIKAWQKGDRELMDAVYSAMPASLVGREQEIDVGPMSGKSNVIFWLEKRGITATDQLVDRIFQKAKASATVLTEEEILAAVYPA